MRTHHKIDRQLDSLINHLDRPLGKFKESLWNIGAEGYSNRIKTNLIESLGVHVAAIVVGYLRDRVELRDPNSAEGDISRGGQAVISNFGLTRPPADLI